jgi:Holliday junction resolvasome RuvABC ATP-dependent DNA helicase subunit
LDKLFPPFKDRLTIVDFKPYAEEELAAILQNKLDWVIFEDGIMHDIAPTLRGNARAAVKRAKEIEMYCEAKNISKFGKAEWKRLCDTLGINASGLTNTEIEILTILKERGDCTLGMLSAATGLSRTAIQRDAELYLLRKGAIKIEGTRKLTPLGKRLLVG